MEYAALAHTGGATGSAHLVSKKTHIVPIVGQEEHD